jgi:hypothetical protein
MNTRAKGRKFEKREEKIWLDAGWEVELVRPEARFIGPGKAVTAYRDFFGRYDLITTSPRVGITVMNQVSTEPPSSHKDPGPMGFLPLRIGGRDVPVDELLDISWPSLMHRGTYEIYTHYKKVGRSYVPVRTWWKRA